MTEIIFGGTLASLGIFGLADQFRRGATATIELVVICALGVGVGLAVLHAGFGG